MKVKKIGFQFNWNKSGRRHFKAIRNSDISDEFFDVISDFFSDQGFREPGGLNHAGIREPKKGRDCLSVWAPNTFTLW